MSAETTRSAVGSATSSAKPARAAARGTRPSRDTSPASAGWMAGAAKGAVAEMASSRPEEADRVSRSISVHEATATERSTSTVRRRLSPKMSREKKPKAKAVTTATGQRVTATATSPASRADTEPDAEIGVTGPEF